MNILTKYFIVAVLIGAPVVLLGAQLCATSQLLIGRFILYDYLRPKAQNYKLFNALDRAVEREGLKIMLLLRICPIFPYIILNYCLGLT